MRDHLVLLAVFSVLTSLVLAFIGKSGAKERIRYFFYLFGSFIILSILASWVMYSFPF